VWHSVETKEIKNKKQQRHKDKTATTKEETNDNGKKRGNRAKRPKERILGR